MSSFRRELMGRGIHLYVKDGQLRARISYPLDDETRKRIQENRVPLRLLIMVEAGDPAFLDDDNSILAAIHAVKDDADLETIEEAIIETRRRFDLAHRRPPRVPGFKRPCDDPVIQALAEKGWRQ